MKTAKFLKTIIISCLLVTSFVITGCGGNKPDKSKEIEQAVNTLLEFLDTVKTSGNYSSVSEYSDGRVFKYYTQDGKIKVEYNGVFYGIKEENRLYKISQAEDTTWHKHTDTTDLADPVTRTDTLIRGINNTTGYSLWTDYDSKTKTLTATYSDGIGTFQLDGGIYVQTMILDGETTPTRHTVKDVGSTTVTLPENIIDDTQPTES